MKKLNNKKYYDLCGDDEDYYEAVDDDEFEIGQSYSGVPDKKIVCRKCGSERWIVGTGEYHTSIKCPNCLYEICIHEG